MAMDRELKSYWNGNRGDNFTTATQQGEQAAQAAEYSFLRVEGYVYPDQQPNTVPLKSYWGPARGDNFTTATPQGEQDALGAGYSFVRVEGYVVPPPQVQPPIGPQPTTTLAITKTVEGDVGNHKFMRTSATLYRNGSLMVSAYTRNTHWSEGLRGRVLVVCVDSMGNAMWVSPLFQCTTRGSRGDVFTSSRGTDLFQANFPSAVGKYTHYLDIYQGDAGSRPWEQSRDAIIGGIRAAREIAQEVKDALGALV